MQDNRTKEFVCYVCGKPTVIWDTDVDVSCFVLQGMIEHKFHCTHCRSEIIFDEPLDKNTDE